VESVLSGAGVVGVAVQVQFVDALERAGAGKLKLVECRRPAQ
jgi:hypothetical protein